ARGDEDGTATDGTQGRDGDRARRRGGPDRLGRRGDLRAHGLITVSRIPGDPGLGRQALFALGGRLPERNREWVRHELTDAGWRGRLIIRHIIAMLPFCAILALLPGAAWIRVAVPGLFLI